MMSVSVVAHSILIFVCGVVLGDPLREEPRTLIRGTPTIDFGSCPDPVVVQDFEKFDVSCRNCTLHNLITTERLRE